MTKAKKKKKEKKIEEEKPDIEIGLKKGKQEATGAFEQMSKAYSASAKMMKAKMKKERAEDLNLLDKAADDNIIIVKGQYDKVELVMNAVGLEYIFLEQEAVGRIDFRPDQILIINCPGDKIDDQGIKDIKQFVNDGGFLLSTDWVLKNVLEKAFPGYIKFNGKTTGDEVVGIEVIDKSHPFIKGMFSDVSNPQWWLEGSSYPIRILNNKKVEILIKSKEMKKRYGDDPVVVFFNYGKGKVMHMLSHYYLQRTETKTARQKKSAKAYAAEMKLSEEDLNMKELEDVSLGEIESAYTTAQFIGNLIVEKQKENIEFEKDRNRRLEIKKKNKIVNKV